MKAVWRQVFGVVVVGALCAGPAVAQAPGQSPSLAPRGAANEESKVGIFDMQRVLVKSVTGVAAREALERERAVMQKDVDGKRVELEKLKDEIDKKGPLMTAEARREKEDAFERKRRDYARLRDDSAKELEKKEKELLRRMYREIHSVIQQVGERGRFLAIIDKQAVVNMAPAADVTDEIIRAYDQQQPKGTKPGP